MSSRYHEYVRDGRAIYDESFATIRSEAELEGVPESLEKTAVRIIHGCGMVDIVGDLDYSAGVAEAARGALHAGQPVLCDSQMVAQGITRTRLPADNPVICTLHDERVPERARAIGNTRSAAAVDLWDEHLAGAVVAIGNAPTTLFYLLNRLRDGAPHPAAVIGLPVGFVGAVESKAALADTPALEFLTVHGRRGGSAMAAAAINALASDRE